MASGCATADAPHNNVAEIADTARRNEVRMTEPPDMYHRLSGGLESNQTLIQRMVTFSLLVQITG